MFEKKNINLASLSEKGHEIVDDLPFMKKRKRFKLGLKFLRSGFFIVILFFIVVLIFSVFSAYQFKNIYTLTVNGKNQLFQSVEYAKASNWKQSNIYAVNATNNFVKSSDKLGGYSAKIITIIPILGPQLIEIKNLVSSVQVFSSAMVKVSKIGVDYQNLSLNSKTYTELNDKEKHDTLKLIYEVTPELRGIKANINLAVLYLEKLRYIGLLKFFETEIREYKQKLVNLQPILEKSEPIIELLPKLFGYPSQVTFLILLQNRDELRPTGGFLGTYGILQTENGNVQRFDTHDIYHLDMPIKDKLDILPPEPLKKYLGVSKWYMRDANWSPDWPESAKQVEWFFHKEDELLPEEKKINNFSGQFDGVFAVSPDYIIELLKFTGPVLVDGQYYNAENFVDLLQYKVERGYELLGVPNWERKEVIGEISKKLKLIILDKPIKDLFQVFSLTGENLNKKNIILYFKDKELQSISKDFNWSGEVRSAPSDYVYVVDANMAAFKTDSVMKRTMRYEIEQSTGGLFSNLDISYAHTGDFDWRTTRYRTYTRVYLPKEAKVLKVEGFLEEDGYKIYQEFDKTVVAGFFSLEPGQIGNISLYYKLPDSILTKIKEGNYKLLIQKQPGKEVDPLNVQLNFSKNINKYFPTGFFVTKDNNKLKWETNLQTDREFGVEF